MNKQEFLNRLQEGLAGLPREEQEERLTFYREMIEDQMEDGLSEEEAVAHIEPVEEILARLQPTAPKRTAPKRKVWVTVLLAVGSPVWLSLLVAAAAVVLAMGVVLWSLIVALWAVEASLMGTGAGCLIAGAATFAGGDRITGLALLAVALISAGLAIFLFFGCKAATKGAAALTAKAARSIASRWRRKEEA